MMRLALLGTIALLGSVAARADASPRRVAVVVGNNSGGPSQTKLRYAERDARRMARVLKQLGGVGEIKLLVGASAARLRKALRGLAESHKGLKNSLTFLFYYSGHADGRALLMGNTRLPVSELRRTVSAFPARTSVTIIDACQSGAATRGKGGRVVPIVDVRFDDRTPKGRVTITSSARGENSQESDSLMASFFTHYLLSGLRGAADHSGDGKVSLEEAYGYAYQQTVAKTSGTLRGAQHPSYSIDLKGAGQLVLTWLSKGKGHLVLPKRVQGVYYVHAAATGAMVVEVLKRSGQKLRVALAPGRYRVRKVSGRYQLVKTLRVGRTGDVVLSERGMVRSRLSSGTAKGGGELRNVLSLAYSLGSGYLVDAGVGHAVQLEYARRVGPVDLGFTVGYGHSAYEREDGFDVEAQSMTLLLSVAWRYRRWPRVRPVAALDVGGAFVWQRGTPTGGASQVRRAPVFRYRVRAGLEVRLWRQVHLGAWAYAGQIVLERSEGFTAPFVGGFGAGITLDL